MVVGKVELLNIVTFLRLAPSGMQCVFTQNLRVKL